MPTVRARNDLDGQALRFAQASQLVRRPGSGSGDGGQGRAGTLAWQCASRCLDSAWY